jgi:hypothetical protein
MSDPREPTAPGAASAGPESPDARPAAGPGPAPVAPAAGEPVPAAEALRRALEYAGVSWESPAPDTYVVTLPGTRKLSTTCSFRLGRHALSLNAFVIRHPDENEPAVHRWLLERNLRLYGIAYATDSLGDIYLTGRLPLSVITPEEVDRLLGSVLEASDGAFNTLLELGFASSIRREYAWRVSRGESTRNLDAFSRLTREPGDPADG